MLCGKTTSQVLKTTCYQNLGYQVAQVNVGQQEGITKACQTMENQTARDNCMYGAAVETSFQRYFNWQTTVISLCEQTPVDQRAKCLASIN